MTPPLVLDIDGTLTRPDGSIDPRIFDRLRSWDAPVVLATGKAFPYPVALCHFVGIEELVIAENGGVVAAREELSIEGDRQAADAVAATFREAGYGHGWGPLDTVNRWRETELAVSREMPLAVLRGLAADHGLEVVDTGYAYHVKDPAVTKGRGLLTLADLLGRETTEFVAVGDSANDVSTFELVDRSYAVANADEAALAASDHVTDAPFSEGFFEVLDELE
ncbi:phosphoglycolate phosphatase [Natronorarus salvus]|uniref:phosphoglycolate phosphatase n=1 Tax=Natronorarus salvus TaxID=3117733 RepID=UPI002F25F38A